MKLYVLKEPKFLFWLFFIGFKWNKNQAAIYLNDNTFSVT